MSPREKKNNKGFWARLAEKKITNSEAYQEGSELFLLSDDEIIQLREISKKTFIKAGVAGALGVILLYIPYHLFGSNVFPLRKFVIPQNPIYDGIIELEVEFLIFSVILVLIEIWYLTYLNIQAVAAISHTCGHPNPLDTNYAHNVNALIAVGLDKKQKELEQIGINPYEGLSKRGVIIFQFLLKLRAALSNVLFRILVKRALGRYALRLVLDMGGIPVYAFWNIWGARKVMNESKVRVMAPPLIRRCVDDLFEQQKDNKEFTQHVYDTLQLVSESKRSFHYNHFLLSITALNKFGIDIVEDPTFNENFLEEIPKLSEHTRKGIEKLFLFGTMIDGRISNRELKAIRFLIKKRVLVSTEENVKQWANDYFNGKGLEDFFISA